MLVQAYRHIKWGVVSKLLMRALSWRPWIPGTLKLDSILSLFKCESPFELGSPNLKYTVVRELRVHELSQTDLVTLYQLHLLVWENYYIVYVHLIFFKGNIALQNSLQDLPFFQSHMQSLAKAWYRKERRMLCKFQNLFSKVH